MRTRRITYGGSIDIDRSPEAVFTYLDEVERIPEWQEPITQVERLTEGSIAVGSRVAYTLRGGRKVVFEVVEHDPPRCISVQSVGNRFTVHGTITVEARDGGKFSRLTAENKLTRKGLGGRLLNWVSKRYADKRTPKDLHRLKEVLESGVDRQGST